jgi:transposase
MTNLDKKEIDKIRENRKKIYSGEVEMFVLEEIIKDNIKLKNIEDVVKIKNTKIYVNTNRNGHSDIEDTNKYELTYIINKT